MLTAHTTPLLCRVDHMSATSSGLLKKLAGRDKGKH